MRMHCTNCGHGVLASERFCSACGMPVAAIVPQTFPAQWEYCEIREYVIREGGWFTNAEYALTAVAIGQSGTYNAGEVTYKGDSEYEQRSAQALSMLIMRLIETGWERLSLDPQEAAGDKWCNYKFIRQVYRSGRSTMR